MHSNVTIESSPSSPSNHLFLNCDLKLRPAKSNDPLAQQLVTDQLASIGLLPQPAVIGSSGRF